MTLQKTFLGLLIVPVAMAVVSFRWGGRRADRRDRYVGVVRAGSDGAADLDIIKI